MRNTANAAHCNFWVQRHAGKWRGTLYNIEQTLTPINYDIYNTFHYFGLSMLMYAKVAHCAQRGGKCCTSRKKNISQKKENGNVARFKIFLLALFVRKFRCSKALANNNDQSFADIQFASVCTVQSIFFLCIKEIPSVNFWCKMSICNGCVCTITN